jgi:hypothetical protein
MASKLAVEHLNLQIHSVYNDGYLMYQDQYTSENIPFTTFGQYPPNEIATFLAENVIAEQ